MQKFKEMYKSKLTTPEEAVKLFFYSCAPLGRVSSCIY
jgi:hypothetical protein